MTIRIISISDIHSKISSLQAILAQAQRGSVPDLITVSGDISDFGSGEEVESVLRVVEASGIPFCYVLGNCDPKEFRKGVFVTGVCLDARCFSSNGMVFIGSGGSTPTPFGTPFEVEESELLDNLGKLRSSCGSPAPMGLVLHNPPRGEIVDRTRSGLHVGSEGLRDLILEMEPLFVQCGHIHEAVGLELIGKSVVFNPGPAQRGRYAEVEIKDGSVNVVHRSVQ